MNDPVKPAHKLKRNDLCWCGSGKKYKYCHLDIDAAAERAARAETKAADEAIIPRMEEMPSKPLGAGYWSLVALGVVIAVAVGFSKGMSGAIIVAAAWTLGMVAWTVLRDPPPPRLDAGNPAALDFGTAQNPQARRQQERLAAAEQAAEDLARRGSRRQRRQRPR